MAWGRQSLVPKIVAVFEFGPTHLRGVGQLPVQQVGHLLLQCKREQVCHLTACRCGTMSGVLGWHLVRTMCVGQGDR